MNHLIERAKERANIELDVDKIQQLLTDTLENGEFICEGTKGGLIYKLKFEGKTIYPVLGHSGDRILTILSEDQAKRNVHEKKNLRKKYKKDSNKLTRRRQKRKW